MRNLIVFSLFQTVLCVYRTAPDSNDAASRQLLDYKSSHAEKLGIVSAFGTPLDDISSTLSAGPRGPLLLQDITFFERLAHFARERTPERVVHAKGTGAFGTFTVTKDIRNLTRALFLSKIGKQTQVAARFSTSTGSKGSPDTVRDLRGFAVKFFTDDGLFDILGLQTPTFFIRDPMMFPQLTHALKNNPVTNLKDVNMFWDFMSSRPETLLLILFLFGDQIPDCYRYMQGFSGSAYKLVNSNGDVNYAKFKWMPPEVRGLSNEQALNLTATDPDYCGRDLYNAIANRDYPTWTLNIQVMSEAETETFNFNPFDITKLWPEDKFPYQEVGVLTLNRNPDNFFEQVESIGFNPGHLVPGIELSVDKLLHGRMFIYGDTQRHRIGPNFEQMRVNRPGQVRVTNYERDGPQTFSNQGAAPNYYPNRYGGPVNNSRGAITKYSACGEVSRYYEEDNFSLPTLVYQEMVETKKQFLVDNLVGDIMKAQPDIQKTVVDVFSNIGDLGSRLRRRLDN